MSGQNVLLRLENVTKVYDMGETKVYALSNVNLSIKKGEFSAILGPSGSGKSTLLHILGLLDEPTSGKVYLDGIDVQTLSEKQRAMLRGKKIGFVFQMFNLIPSLTVLQNVTLPAIIYETSPAKAEAAAIQILKSIDMGDRLFHYPNQLSGGQRQRVAIARALINEPDIIFADEPTGNLDSKTGQEVLKLFEELNRNGKTIVIVTHDLAVAKITNRIIRVADGKIIKS
ncbi:MAG: ABC transporter ATP-binding protein [Candidatus Micrarchaeota archaeon]|nr:ABC transporter ATP-binding protein [Candidatus Micrarchaeota archaeon]